MKVAALDLGSNTFLLLIADVDPKGNVINKVYRDEVRVTRLGQGVHANKKFHPEALARARACLEEYAEIISKEKPERILAMATSAARDVSNGQELFQMGKELGIPIEIIPGHMEAQITFDGSTFFKKQRSGLAVIDVGGGSTEVIGGAESGVAKGASANVGSVRLTELFVTGHPVQKSEVEKILKYARDKFAEIKDEIPKQKYTEVIAVAGTPTTLAAVAQGQPYRDEIVDGYIFTREQLDEWLWRLAALDLDKRKALPGMDPQRADVIVAGMAILISALDVLHAQKLTVSTKGVRYGVALLAGARK